MKNKGFFIVFEGPDGSGKSTIINMIDNYLKNLQLTTKVSLTREPGGNNNVIAEDIRRILLNKINYKITDRAETLLFAASRAQHVHDFIMPRLNKGEIVICDRYVYSSLVYQGYARGIDINQILQINNFATYRTEPDLVIILMINPKNARERILANSQRDFNRLDQEVLSLHQKVYDGYQKLLDNDKTGKFVYIDSNKTIEEVFEQTKKIILDKIKHYVK